MTNLNEFRQDLVSGDWVLFATGRALRPAPDREVVSKIVPKDKCPFENPEGHGNKVLETFPALGGADGPEKLRNGVNWFAKVAQNKFPIVNAANASYGAKTAGPFSTHAARGQHELVIFRDHDKQLHQFSVAEMSEVFKIYQQRFGAISKEDFVKYILIFHNHGAKAGASLTHPHTQIMSLPLLPPDVEHSITGAERFYREQGKRVYDLMIDWEVKEGRRVVFENDHFIAFCPFVSKSPYEVRIFSKESHAHFEQLPDDLRNYLAETMLVALKKINTVLRDPDYNFFIHTATTGELDVNPHEYYSW
ncbi:MAG: DUF4931 domain-containing protein, partial [Patescibacteria group bacterium]